MLWLGGGAVGLALLLGLTALLLWRMGLLPIGRRRQT
jgi:hypothetical protein